MTTLSDNEIQQAMAGMGGTTDRNQDHGRSL